MQRLPTSPPACLPARMQPRQLKPTQQPRPHSRNPPMAPAAPAAAAALVAVQQTGPRAWALGRPAPAAAAAERAQEWGGCPFLAKAPALAEAERQSTSRACRPASATSARPVQRSAAQPSHPTSGDGRGPRQAICCPRRSRGPPTRGPGSRAPKRARKAPAAPAPPCFLSDEAQDRLPTSASRRSYRPRRAAISATPASGRPPTTCARSERAPPPAPCAARRRARGQIAASPPPR
mmetsp:Transcript_55691/g.174550  ORF Transcript_55691/g.174550 Transcript_55691/m.174550 type:complete len:235 (-) Transcript_55691:212-916(-)